MNARSRKNLGFTLIELMVVVVIVGILAAVAIPSYRSYVTKTHRAAARSCMLEITQFMERYYTTNMTYGTAALVAGGCRTDGGLDTRYTITLGSLAQNTYTVTATPIGVQLASDTACGTLTLDQAGVRNRSGTGNLNNCWSR